MHACCWFINHLPLAFDLFENQDRGAVVLCTFYFNNLLSLLPWKRGGGEFNARKSSAKLLFACDSRLLLFYIQFQRAIPADGGCGVIAASAVPPPNFEGVWLLNIPDNRRSMRWWQPASPPQTYPFLFIYFIRLLYGLCGLVLLNAPVSFTARVNFIFNDFPSDSTAITSQLSSLGRSKLYACASSFLSTLKVYNGAVPA